MFKNKEIIDISLPLVNEMARYPGDPGLEIKQEKSIPDDDFNMTSLFMGVHNGTHLDAPLHFVENGKSIDQIPLERFMGTAQVIEIENQEEITVAELKKHELKANFVLFKTANSNNDNNEEFNYDFIYLNEEAAAYLLKEDITLIGIDYLSVEQYGQPEAPVHHLLLENEIVVLEGLNLKNVAPGLYTLIALPLNIVGSEGTPTRAILLKE